MKKGQLMAIGAIIGVIILAAIVFFGWLMGTRNSFVTLEEDVNSKWSMVQTAYQRRADLIPNLVDTVQASAEFESNLLINVTRARAGISDADTPEELAAAGAEVERAINVVFENYPQIRSTEGFLNLQTQLEGTENRIKVERDNYNRAVQSFNTRVRLFPSSIAAGWFGFQEKPYFEAEPGAEEAPDVGELFEN